MDQHEKENAINPLPPVVIALCVFFVGIELMFWAGKVGLIGGPEALGWRIKMIGDWGFQPQILTWMFDSKTYPLDEMVRFISYPFFHYDFMHLTFVLVFLLALGKWVGEIFSALSFLVVFFGASIVGALVYWAVWDTSLVLFGGYPGVYGLIGAYSYILFARLGEAGQNQLGAFRIIGVLLAVQLIFGVFFGAGKSWVAEVSGFAAGFALSFIVSPGGWAAIVARLRRR